MVASAVEASSRSTLGRAADLGEHEVELDLGHVLGRLREHALDRLERALGVGAQQQVDRLGLRLAEQVGERQALAPDRLALGLLALRPGAAP
jgi:hypothetical protein